MDRKPKMGFTLVELLTVITLIAILAAIAFPVMAKMKASAKNAVCISNARQLGVAVALYAVDYDDALPIAPSPVLKRSVELGNVSFGEPYDSHILASPDLKEVLGDYKAAHTLWKCPLDSYFDQVTGLRISEKTWYEEMGGSYETDWDWIPGKSLTQYEDPSWFGMIGEVTPFHSEPSPRALTTLLYADMHAKLVPWSLRVTQLQGNGPGP